MTELNNAMVISQYAESHKAAWVPVNYDDVIYNANGCDSFAWSIQRPFLVRLLSDITPGRGGMKYLDFACGTGRIISAVEHLASESIGLDTSSHMLELAQTKVSMSKLRCGDLLEDPHIVEFDYDVITAFRFFLNTEPEMRPRIMRSLASRLADGDSRLIFNVHANGWSVDALKSLYQRMRGWGPASTMTFPEVRRLVNAAGLEIESWYGFGLWPSRFYRTGNARVFHQLDRLASARRLTKWISHDMLFVCRRGAGANVGRAVRRTGKDRTTIA